jgi:hypothetical protein
MICRLLSPMKKYWNEKLTVETVPAKNMSEMFSTKGYYRYLYQ